MRISGRAPAMVLVIALLCTGCAKDDEPAGPIEGAPPAELVGTWAMTSVTVDGQPADLAEILQWAENSVSSEFTVQASGLYTYREYNAQGLPTFLAAGTITISGSGFTVSITTANGTPIPAQKQSGTWEIVGGELRLTTVQDIGGSSATVVVVCVKK